MKVLEPSNASLSLINPCLQNANSQRSARSYLLDANIKTFNFLLPSNNVLRFCGHWNACPSQPSGTQPCCDYAGGHLLCTEHQASCARLERSQHDLWYIVTAASRRDSLAQEPITVSPWQYKPNRGNMSCQHCSRHSSPGQTSFVQPPQQAGLLFPTCPGQGKGRLSF